MKTISKKKTEEKPVPKKEEVVKVVDTSKEESKHLKSAEEKIHVSEIKIEEKSSLLMRSLIPFFSGLLFGLFLGGLFIVYMKGGLVVRKEVTPEISPTPTPIEKQASESASLVKDLSLYDLKILNGSGKPGEAAKLENNLKAQGFSVLDIGNADRSDYKKTVVKYKEKVSSDFLKILATYLSSLFELDEPEKLADKEETDIVVIVGSTAKSEATVSATPKVTPKSSPKPTTSE